MRLFLTLVVGLFAAPLVAQEIPEWAAPAGDNPYGMEGPAIESIDGPGLPATPAAVPLDGGLGLLALAGGAYAAKKLRDRRTD